jgi:hypothetical protein
MRKKVGRPGEGEREGIQIVITPSFYLERTTPRHIIILNDE